MKSECKKFGENSRQMAPVSTICDEYCRLLYFCCYHIPIKQLGKNMTDKVDELTYRQNLGVPH